MAPQPRQCRTVLGLCLALALSLASGVAQGQKKKNDLPKYYSEWLNHDVAYIITKQERANFLKLPSDAARDNFIKRFWAIRNPVRDRPSNTYKDEIYHRIAYANAHYGVGAGGEGWRSDRGRTYITLGAPSRCINTTARRIFGRSRSGSTRTQTILVPPPSTSFSISAIYRRFPLLQPLHGRARQTGDGTEAVNDPQSAIKLIQSSVGSEVARFRRP